MQLVFLTVRVHLFPFRTQKLSSPVPKILVWRRTGKIGQCQHKKSHLKGWLFLCWHCFYCTRGGPFAPPRAPPAALKTESRSPRAPPRLLRRRIHPCVKEAVSLRVHFLFARAKRQWTKRESTLGEGIPSFPSPRPLP